MSYPEAITREEEARVKAQTVIEQVGVSTRMACGFRKVSYESGEQVAFNKGPSERPEFDVRVRAKVGRANRLIEIVLDFNDTYTVRLIKVPTARAKDPSLVVLEETSDVYADVLGEVVYHKVNK